MEEENKVENLNKLGKVNEDTETNRNHKEDQSDDENGAKAGKKHKTLLTIAVVGVLVFIYFKYFRGVDAENIRAYISGYGRVGPLVYILLFTLLPMAFFPVPVLALAAGLSFGLWAGTLYTVIGAGINCILMFFMAKFLAKDMVKGFLADKLPEKWMEQFDKADGKRGFMIIFILRLIPFMPYNVINYGAGLTSIGFGSYLSATIIGILPGTLVFLNIGDKAVDVKDPAFILSIVLLVLLAVVSVILAKKVSPGDFGDKK
ncbi:MAG: TVP38/TMEM64 family protein [Clostridioides sp.]|jgi:uncharacterized membrane protein YdjX (TVP38/TMEM64 family)|nr:TVP38/TMEM64 family protein [Clostridioides sp.]